MKSIKHVYDFWFWLRLVTDDNRFWRVIVSDSLAADVETSIVCFRPQQQ